MQVSTFFKNLFSSKKGTDVGKRFDLMGRSGQGSMSKVFRARDRNIGRVVCLKILDKEKTKRFEARFPKLLRPTEGALLMGLRHKNVVQTFDHGVTTEGEQFIVMELIEGPGLNFLIETHSPNLTGKRVDYLIQTADGLEYVHQQGFMHRDICPRNIMITSEGIVKLIDFGLTIPNQPIFCKPGNRTGTPNYLAPEIIKRVGTDQRVDLFALGVTAYETFTGELPWEKSRSLETLLKHLNTSGRDPREYDPNMEETLAKFLIKAIKRDPRERFQTAAAFRDALKALPKQDY
ncbi:MAG TPA: serine/threonine-protein kinase [Gemmataceae bacterium]|nr:serine/threonine-protein kinase [Gemmataceae bacterium]